LDYHKELKRLVGEEMHKIIDWNVPFGYVSYNVFLLFDHFVSIKKETILRVYEYYNISEIDMEKVEDEAREDARRYFTKIIEKDGQEYGTAKFHFIAYKDNITLNDILNRVQNTSVLYPMVFFGFCD